MCPESADLDLIVLFENFVADLYPDYVDAIEKALRVMPKQTKDHAKKKLEEKSWNLKKTNSKYRNPQRRKSES